MPKNYCNRTPIVKVIVENVVTCFGGTQCSNDQTGFVLRNCLKLLEPHASQRPVVEVLISDCRIFVTVLIWFSLQKFIKIWGCLKSI